MVKFPLINYKCGQFYAVVCNGTIGLGIYDTCICSIEVSYLDTRKCHVSSLHKLHQLIEINLSNVILPLHLRAWHWHRSNSMWFQNFPGCSPSVYRTFPEACRLPWKWRHTMSPTCSLLYKHLYPIKTGYHISCTCWTPRHVCNGMSKCKLLYPLIVSIKTFCIGKLGYGVKKLVWQACSNYSVFSLLFYSEFLKQCSYYFKGCVSLIPKSSLKILIQLRLRHLFGTSTKWSTLSAAALHLESYA